MKIDEDFIIKHWFQLSILVVVLFITWTAYSALVLQPEKDRQEEASRQEAIKIAEQEKQEKLETCLAESEYERNTGHIALCGDPNIGSSPTSCRRVFGGTKNYSELLDKFSEEFPNSLPEIPDTLSLSSSEEEKYKILSEIVDKNAQIVSNYWEKCNCGLAKYRRDELDTERKTRDTLCLQKYGK